MAKDVELQILLNDVKTKKLLLPDFQRKFVWAQEKMCKLYASVLSRMPLGSILILNSDDKDFSCKEIGAIKPNPAYVDQTKNGTEVSFLIDGQQRLTSLFAGFTTYFLEQFKSRINEIDQILLDMYFIKIPAETNNDEDVDIFNIRRLDFNNNEYKANKYLSSELLFRLIEPIKIQKVFGLDEKKKITSIPDVTNKENMKQLKSFCCSEKEGYFYIPLQIFNNDNPGIQNYPLQILRTIASHYYLDELDTEENSDAQERWADNVKKYFEECLSNIDLNRIIVEKSDKARAIDIYSNLNLGGVSLSVFDLLMARVGGYSDKNFYQTIIDYIRAGNEKEYPRELLRNEAVYAINCSNRQYKNACTDVANVISENDETITKEYINVFLNVLGLYVNKDNNNDINKIIKSIKQETLLSIKGDIIKSSAQNVCKGIERAMFFFQTRCGIRTISDINYKAQLSLIAYFFTNDEYFYNPKIHAVFEYWYWISIFGYMFKSNQNVAIYNYLPSFQNYFDDPENNENILNEIRDFKLKWMLKFPEYSDKETMILKDGNVTPPPSVMSKYVCQFYLSTNYQDLCIKKDGSSKEELNFMYIGGFDAHHIMPLGSDPNLTIGETTRSKRQNPKDPFNSPLNMLYITKPSNKKIGAMTYLKYSKEQNMTITLKKVGCTINLESDRDLPKFLSERFDDLQTKLDTRTKELYTEITGKQEN